MKRSEAIPAVLKYAAVLAPGDSAEMRPLPSDFVSMDGRVMAIFRGDKMEIDTGHPALAVTSIKGDEKEQLSGPIPAFTFVPGTLGSGVKWPTIIVGQTIAITLKNSGNTEIRVAATISGRRVV